MEEPVENELELGTSCPEHSIETTSGTRESVLGFLLDFPRAKEKTARQGDGKGGHHGGEGVLAKSAEREEEDDPWTRTQHQFNRS